MQRYYTYCLKIPSTGRLYIGSRAVSSILELTPETFMERYPILPYQKELLKAKEEGEKIECILLECYPDNRKAALDRETEEILEADALTSDQYINKYLPFMPAGEKISEGNKRARLEKPEAFAICSSPEARAKMSEAQKTRHSRMTDEERELLKRKKSKAMKEWCKSEENRKIRSDDTKASWKKKKEDWEKHGRPPAKACFR